MELIRSNRTEKLAAALASRVCEKPLGPFAREVIVVQSRGMARWLTLALAEKLGSWSNPAFPFPRAVIEQVLTRIEEGRAEHAKAYEPAQLKWTIAGLLRESAPVELEAYLGVPSNPDRVLRLASSASVVFDRYVLYRPTLLRQWSNGAGGDWQAELWRRVVQRLGPHDLASRIRDALETLRSTKVVAELPFERLHLFSLETLPPLFLELFSALSESVETTFYVLEPSSEYVSDVDPTLGDLISPDAAPSDGHPLLSSLGRLARDFQQVLLSADRAVQYEADLFEAPKRDNLLGALQADILEFRSAPKNSERRIIDPADDSISIHACTGPMREVQALHEWVQSALESDRSLQPEDVVVMTPDLDTYAPAFRAVFGQDDLHRIPYEVHDRSTRDDAAFYDDFQTILELLDSRFSVLDFVRILDAGALRATFLFTQEERARLAELLAASGIRWGIDAAHREALEFPADPLHTWRAGLGRLFLGFASTPDDTSPFEGLLPRGAPSLSDAELLARLSRLSEVLFDFHRRSREPLSIEDWTRELEHFSALLFAEDDEGSSAMRTLREAIADLRDVATRTGYDGPIALKTLRRELGAILQEKAPAVGFLRRGVTMTELVPLRSVPFRVVCLVGMSEESFPRADDRPSFDHSRATHQHGDRNKRDDDRHSFLQAVLCARDRLRISYSAPAHNPSRGANPSPVVWELCETLRRYYVSGEGAPVLAPTMHPLHPFDARYFEPSALPRSCSERHLEIACALRQAGESPRRIELCTEADEALESLSVNELSAWLWNPMSTFVERVLRARFEATQLYEPSQALTTIGRREAALLGNAALRVGLRDAALDAYLDAAPEFPDGNWGALERQRLASEIRMVDARGDALRTGHEIQSTLVSAELNDLLLEGRLDGIDGPQRLLKRFTKPGRRTELTIWIEHLLMQTFGELPKTTHLVLRGTETRAETVSFAPVADPHAELRNLVTLYVQSRERPLPLLGESSWLFMETRNSSGSGKAFSEAAKLLSSQRAWNPSLDYALGEEDPFSDSDWREAFEQAAAAVYEPLLRHRTLV
jgi:exodeoxyribonuclease V gamma subunit